MGATGDTGRRFLLIVRAGDRSLHPMWVLGRHPDRRNWDLHVSYFGDQEAPFPDRPSDVTISHEKGPKFLGLLTAFEKIGPRLKEYDYVGLPDDDLLASVDDWTRFFEIIAEHRPSLAQPALHRRSFFSYSSLLQRRGMRLRWTNFVEVMTPAFSRDALALAIPYFAENKSGWGMDTLWARLFNAKSRTLCVVDETPVLHTRAVGVGPLYKRVLASADSPHVEKHAFLSRHGLREEPFELFGAIDRRGQLVEGPRHGGSVRWLETRQWLRKKFRRHQLRIQPKFQ